MPLQGGTVCFQPASDHRLNHPDHSNHIYLPPQGNGATSILLQAATWSKDPVLVDDFRRWCIVWPYAIKQVWGAQGGARWMRLRASGTGCEVQGVKYRV